MSTFSGKIEEIDDISVDKFTDFTSKAYFLSHCHNDHMDGLQSPRFQNHLLQTDNVYLYASSVSILILKQMFPLIKPKLKQLDLYNSTIVKIARNYITVTSIPAGHCPGSIMFLFETDKNILYTGDYRLYPNDLEKFLPFKDSMRELKKIDVMYLDTTFLNESYLTFPTRAESMKELCNLIRNFLKDENNTVQLIASARYGSEYLFIELVKELKMPIHVSEEKYKLYCCVPDMDGVVTTDGKTTRLHSACGDTYKSICKTSNVIKIKPSAMIWKNDNYKNGITGERTSGTHSVCYSCHASYEESLALIKYLKPKKIIPCVVPENYYLKQKLLDLIEKLIKEYTEIEEDEKIFFNIKKTSNEILKTVNCDILSSPPRSAKKSKFN